MCINNFRIIFELFALIPNVSTGRIKNEEEFAFGCNKFCIISEFVIENSQPMESKYL